MYRLRILTLVLILILTHVVTAQDENQDASNSLPLTVEANDGLSLHGEFFASYGGDGRVVLLLHELYTTRASWYPIIEPLRSAGYHVLAVDLRGYGETRGRINWTRAQEDTQTWLNWLYLEPGIRGNAVFIMGSSMGSSLALVGCAEAEACAGSVAISPGRSYFGVSVDDAIDSGTPTLLVYADRDYYPRRAIPYLTELEGFNGEVITYSGRAHGKQLFATEDDLLAQIIAWMNQRR